MRFEEFVDLSRYVEGSGVSDTDPVHSTATEQISEHKPPERSSHSAPSSSTGARPAAEAGLQAAFEEFDGRGTSLPNLDARDPELGAETQESGAATSNATGKLASSEKPFHATRASASPLVPGPAEVAVTHRFAEYTYKLVALVEHEGPATDQGHYVCYVKHMVSENWFRADDKVVEPVDLHRVLAACPYILFYQRLSESSGGTKPLTISGQSQPLEQTLNVCPQMDTSFAGLREQLQVASCLSQGHWRQWQNLIVGLFSSRRRDLETGQWDGTGTPAQSRSLRRKDSNSLL